MGRRDDWDDDRDDYDDRPRRPKGWRGGQFQTLFYFVLITFGVVAVLMAGVIFASIVRGE